MEGIQNKQAGFNIVELLVIVVAVGVIGVGGWFVYQHNRVKLTGAAAGMQTTNQGTNSASTTPPPTTTVVKIPELGIQISVPDDMKDLIYQVSTVTLTGGKQGTLAMFSTKALEAADPGCGPGSMPLGSLQKVDGQYPTATQDPYAALDYGRLVKQFPDFFISAGSPNGACSTSSHLPQPVSGSWKSEFSNATSTVQLLN